MKGIIRGKADNLTYWIDGQQVTKEAFDLAFPDKPLAGAEESLYGWKPVISDALAVHPRQVKEAIDDAIKKGVPTDFKEDGRPEFRTRQHFAEYCRAYGYYNRAAGYGDPAPGSFRG